ncbi:hypothetical protein CR513_05583, partial [Mucuna pruriens]
MNFVISLPRTFVCIEFLQASYLIGIPGLCHIFLQSLHQALGTNLRLSLTYQPQTDGQSERIIQSLEDLLRACMSGYECLSTSGDFTPLLRALLLSSLVLIFLDATSPI